jgi:MFS family permease
MTRLLANGIIERHPAIEYAMLSFLRLLERFERAMFGRLPEAVRFNARVELAASVLYGAFFAASLAFLPVVLRRLGADASQLALYITLTYVGNLLSPLSLLLLRKRSALDVTTIVWGIGRSIFALGIFVTQPNMLLGIAGLFWIAEMLPGPAYSQIVRQCYPSAYRGRAMSGTRVGMTIAVLVLTPLAGQLLDIYGHQLLLAGAAFLGVLSLIVFAYLRPIEPAGPPPAALSLKRMLAIVRLDRRFTIYLLAMTVYGLGGVMPMALYPIVQVSRLQLSYSQIGLLALVQSLFWLIGYFFWGRLLDRQGSVWVLRIAMILAAVVPFTYIWANTALLLVPAFVAQGLLQGAFELGATNTAIDLAVDGQVLEYSAIQTATIGLRGMLAPFIGAALIQIGITESWLFTGCVTLILAAVLMMGLVQSRSKWHPGKPV